MSTRIYTKTGDEGMTSLLGGTKVPKSHVRIETYGTVDELNCHVGMVSDQVLHSVPEEYRRKQLQNELKEIQDRLFTIGAALAVDPEKESKMTLPDLGEDDVRGLEQHIDAMTAELAPMKSFILPGGHVAVSATHIARCVCRRAERLCVFMKEQQLFVPPLVIKYLNRLSDYLFTLARYLSEITGSKEVEWKARV